MNPALAVQTPRPGRSDVTGSRGAVTAMTETAARSGAEVLASGGNAADAAVAACLASGVAEPSMSGLGGTAYAVVGAPGSEPVVIEGSATCPAEAREDMFAPLPGVGGGLYGFPPTKGDAAETGPLSVCAPTCPSVLFDLQQKFGRLRFSEVAAPAIRLAEDGFVPDWAFSLHAAAGLPRLRKSPGALPLYTRPDGSPFVAKTDRETLRLPDLARALRTLAEEGPEPFTEGDVARRIVAGAREAGGVLSLPDMAGAVARTAAPLEFRFLDRRVTTLPGNSGGPTLAAALVHAAALLPHAVRLPREALARPEPESGREATFAHVVAESLRLAFADRFVHLGDPESDAVPLAGLLDPDYLAARRAGVRAEGPRLDDLAEPDPWTFGGPGTDGGAGSVPATGRAIPAADCTTHVNAMDDSGLAVALTATLGGRFGSAFVPPGVGFPLNNGMMWFDPRPGSLISPRPGRRALHAAAPAILFGEDGAPEFAAGAAGGRRLISAAAMTLLRLSRSATVQEAAGGPGLHVETGPVFLDERTPDAASVARRLEALGHEAAICRETAITGHFGRASAIHHRRSRGSGRLFAPGVDPVRTAAGVAVSGP